VLKTRERHFCRQGDLLKTAEVADAASFWASDSEDAFLCDLAYSQDLSEDPIFLGGRVLGLEAFDRVRMHARPVRRSGQLRCMHTHT
jgi:hypothetical protein